MGSIVEARHLEKRYGSFVEVEDVSFSVEERFRSPSIAAWEVAGSQIAVAGVLALRFFRWE